MKPVRIAALVLSAALLPAMRGEAPPDCCADPASAAADARDEAAALRPDSLYHLSSAWRAQNGRPFALGELRGRSALLAMIFTRCGRACPRLVEDLKTIEARLPEDPSQGPRIVLVTMDPNHDDPETLARYARQRGLDTRRWILLQGEPGAARELAAALGAAFRQSAPNAFEHSNQIALLDSHGSLVYTLKGLRADPESLLARLRAGPNN